MVCLGVRALPTCSGVNPGLLPCCCFFYLQLGHPRGHCLCHASHLLNLCPNKNTSFNLIFKTPIPNEAHLIDEAKCLFIHLISEGLHHVRPTPRVCDLNQRDQRFYKFCAWLTQPLHPFPSSTPQPSLPSSPPQPSLPPLQPSLPLQCANPSFLISSNPFTKFLAPVLSSYPIPW